MQQLIDRLSDTSALAELNQPLALLYLVASVAVLLLGRVIYRARVGYDLNHELGSSDNPAVAIAFSGYMFALGNVLFGVLTAGGLATLQMDLIDLAVTGAVGAILLYGNQVLMDRVSFRSLSLGKAIGDRNIAAALVQAGGYIGSGMIIAQAIRIEGASLGMRLLDASIFFAVTQVAFILFTLLYQRMTSFDLHAEIERGNPAVALSYAMALIATGHVLAYAIGQTASLVVLAAWFVGSGIALHAFRFVIDKLVLPGHDLDRELSKDQNWGVALLEGSLVIALAQLLTGAF